uniref:CBF1-interacting co-repressor CIR N-terminal domain-containing protein n=1 Tax=Homalodisca liturata TaxID=320908 RepID=A0A1B6HXB8_9HEMI
MGKGFNNYMCKKFFHPASRDNLKRVWMAEQKADSYKKKQEELRVQYEKEQDLYNNKAMLSKESKDKLSVNFMYEPPPGAKKEREREDDEPEYKFEWQRKFNAPREDYCKGDSEIRDQPFGIQVRNVRCIKCHKWGHINTDKECPLFKQASVSQTANGLDPLLLVRQMKEDGLAMKKSALDTQHHIGLPHTSNRSMIPSEDEEDTQVTQEDLKILKSLSTKKKLKLLRKLEKMENGGCVKKNSGKKDKKKKKKKEKDESDLEERRKKKKSSKKTRSNKREKYNSDTSSNESDVDSDSDSVHTSRKHKKKTQSSNSENSKLKREPKSYRRERKVSESSESDSKTSRKRKFKDEEEDKHHMSRREDRKEKHFKNR